MRRSFFLLPVVSVFCATATLLASTALQSPSIAAQGSASISGVMYFDDNMNGIRDEGEKGAPGRVIEVVDAADSVSIRARSGNDGRYRVEGLSAQKEYMVQLVKDAETPCGESSIMPVSPDNRVDIDFAVIEGTGRISGALVDDQNENGRRDSGESGERGWSVLLQGGPEDGMGDCIVSVTTGARGEFRFNGLPDGLYSLLIGPSEATTDKNWEITFPTAPDQDFPYLLMPVDLVSLSRNVRSVEIDFGVHVLEGSGTIGLGRFIDYNQNETRDEGEPLMECWRSGWIGLRRQLAGVGLLYVYTHADVSCVDGVTSVGNLSVGSYRFWFPEWCEASEQPGPPSHPDTPTMLAVGLGEGETAYVEYGRCPAGWVEVTTPASTPSPLPPTIGLPDAGISKGGTTNYLYGIACLLAAFGLGAFTWMRHRC